MLDTATSNMGHTEPRALYDLVVSGSVENGLGSTGPDEEDDSVSGGATSQSRVTPTMARYEADSEERSAHGAGDDPPDDSPWSDVYGDVTVETPTSVTERRYCEA
jgi:hypothetical protein